VAVGTATYDADLRARLEGPSAASAWDPPRLLAGACRVALILGVASVPFSICLISGALGVLAVIARPRAAPRDGRADRPGLRNLGDRALGGRGCRPVLRPPLAVKQPRLTICGLSN
jgi:hypothetical protein